MVVNIDYHACQVVSIFSVFLGPYLVALKSS